MTRQTLSYAEVIEIVELLRSSAAFSEFRLKSGDLEVEVRRQGAAPATPDAVARAGALPSSAPSPTPSPTPSATVPAQEPASTYRYSERAVMLRSPMVGTFYRAPEPGAEPFVKVGQAVQANSPVCIIEVMKLMNTVAAGCDGVVVDILVPDAGAVEYGQLLVVIEPN